jgi:cellulose synthase operon protein C
MTGTGFFGGGRLFALLLASVLLLTACDSAEERAEEHFQSGMAFLEEGDVDRALIEFRNVFKLNGNHREARLAYARLERERGNISASFGQYLRLIEQDPDNLEGRRALAEMALETGNWEELERHGTAAAELAPDDPQIRSLNIALAYTQALSDGDTAAAAAAAQDARALLGTDTELMTARRTLIDHLVRRRDWQDALEQIDAALALGPEMGGLYAIRLSILQEMDRPAEVEDQLLQMAKRFPDDEGVKQLLVRHYIERDDLDAAERFLRAEAQAGAEYLPVQRLVAFLDQYRGPGAAIDELDRIIAGSGPEARRLGAMRAVLKFRVGDTDTAIGEMQALLEGAERTEATREIEAEYARLLFQADRQAEARALVETMLAEDPTQIDALKFKAAWLIEEDQTGDAIVLLRNALGQAPRDPQLMTLMAQAHERNGDRALMGEMLALAVETSLNAAPESLRYARFLIADGNFTVAESVLIDALRLAPEDPALLAALGDLYVRTQDWPRLGGVIDALGKLPKGAAGAMVAQLRTAMLTAQDRTDDLAAYLERLAEDPEFELPAELALVRARLDAGDTAAALARLDRLLAEAPDSVPLRVVKAHALRRDGKPAEAEALYRAILGGHPQAAHVWTALHDLKVRQGDGDAAQAVLDDALAALPQDAALLMMQAAAHERAGRLQEAIEVYETLYRLDSQSVVVANNLASLLSTARDDDASLERAYTLSRRLKDTREPAYQDTYGWIAHRLGQHDDALRYLEPAAAALPGEPVVHYHLGKAYAALERGDDALRAYRTALDLAEKRDPPPDFTADLLAEVERLTQNAAVGQ